MDCTKYNIDYEALYLLLVPPHWLVDYDTDLPKEVWVEYLKSLASSFENYRDDLLNTCISLKAFLLPTGQHLSLEEHLNDLYDPISRRLFITENDIPAVFNFWYLQGEDNSQPQSWYQQGETDPVPKTWYLRIETDVRKQFTVNIPLVITYIEELLKGNIDPYVVNGYEYNIVTF